MQYQLRLIFKVDPSVSQSLYRSKLIKYTFRITPFYPFIFGLKDVMKIIFVLLKRVYGIRVPFTELNM